METELFNTYIAIKDVNVGGQDDIDELDRIATMESSRKWRRKSSCGSIIGRYHLYT